MFLCEFRKNPNFKGTIDIMGFEISPRKKTTMSIPVGEQQTKTNFIASKIVIDSTGGGASPRPCGRVQLGGRLVILTPRCHEKNVRKIMNFGKHCL